MSDNDNANANDNANDGIRRSSNAANNEIQARLGVDNRLLHTWVFEPATSNMNTKALTDAGVEAIANHQYKSGKYTFLDNLLNPVWTGLTELLPMWLAPNMVTILGTMHCVVAYATVWYYAPNFDTAVPDWVVGLAGYCSVAYYTFDCMDGKQARRTGSSSPLGQLFDHGCDCICNLAHVSTVTSYIMVGGTRWFFSLFGSLFFCFFVAQWEEYYTGELPHAMGNFGVTEVNYILGFLAIGNAFIDREAFWTSALGDYLPGLPSALGSMELRHFGLSAWLMTSCILLSASIHRVLNHENVFQPSENKDLRVSSASKLTTPFLISIVPYLLSDKIIQQETRALSICMGLLLSYLTMKMICFSMAQQSYASIQMEAVPFFGIIFLIMTDARNASFLELHPLLPRVLLGGLCVWYAHRLLDFARKAIEQICTRLDIRCFSIKPKANKAE